METAVAGSFKFKPEIDALHEEFRDHDVLVLEPTVGWLYRPTADDLHGGGFRPLPTERGQDIRGVEERFLRAVERADFMYLFNPNGYIGSSTAFEIGYAIACGKPIFSLGQIDGMELAEGDIEMARFLENYIIQATPAKAGR